MLFNLFLNNHAILLNIVSWGTLDTMIISQSPASHHYHLLLWLLCCWLNIATFSVNGGVLGGTFLMFPVPTKDTFPRPINHGVTLNNNIADKIKLSSLLTVIYINHVVSFRKIQFLGHSLASIRTGEKGFDNKLG